MKLLLFPFRPFRAILHIINYNKLIISKNNIYYDIQQINYNYLHSIAGQNFVLFLYCAP